MSTQVLTINVVDSFPDFTYSFLVTNAITANVLFSSVQSNALTSNSASFIVPMEANAIGNVLVTGNVVDSQGYGMQATNTFVIQATTSTNTSTTTTVVTTVPPQIIQSSGEGGSGGGGSTGTAGKHKPMVLQYINGNETGYEILNFSEQDSVTVAYNTTLTVDENFITPSSAGISINGKSISLSPNLRVKFMDTIDYAYFADLTDISYQPTLHLITVLVYRQPTNMGIPPVTTIPATTVSTIPTTVAGEITNTTGSSTTSSSSGGLVPLLPWIGEGVAIAIAIAIGLLYPRRNKQKK
jgi:hypothetical protein